MVITFNCNRQSGDGPYVEVDDKIKGFSVMEIYFKLQYQILNHNSNTSELTIVGDSYNFTLKFS
jgi:hypothetical protein